MSTNLGHQIITGLLALYLLVLCLIKPTWLRDFADAVGFSFLGLFLSWPAPLLCGWVALICARSVDQAKLGLGDIVPRNDLELLLTSILFGVVVCLPMGLRSGFLTYLTVFLPFHVGLAFTSRAHVILTALTESSLRDLDKLRRHFGLDPWKHRSEFLDDWVPFELLGCSKLVALLSGPPSRRRSSSVPTPYVPLPETAAEDAPTPHAPLPEAAEEDASATPSRHRPMSRDFWKRIPEMYADAEQKLAREWGHKYMVWLLLAFILERAVIGAALATAGFRWSHSLIRGSATTMTTTTAAAATTTTTTVLQHQICVLCGSCGLTLFAAGSFYSIVHKIAPIARISSGYLSRNPNSKSVWALTADHIRDPMSTEERIAYMAFVQHLQNARTGVGLPFVGVVTKAKLILFWRVLILSLPLSIVHIVSLFRKGLENNTKAP